MTASKQKDLDFALLILRVSLGAFFVVAGLAQVANWAGGYRDTFSGFAIVEQLGSQALISILFPWIELIIGMLLIAGLSTSLVAAVTALLSFVFAVVTGFTQGASLAKEILFVAVALALMLLGGGAISLDGKINRGG